MLVCLGMWRCVHMSALGGCVYSYADVSLLGVEEYGWVSACDFWGVNVVGRG